MSLLEIKNVEGFKIYWGWVFAGLLLTSGLGMFLETPLWISALISGFVGVTINELVTYLVQKKSPKQKLIIPVDSKKERHLKLVQK